MSKRQLFWRSKQCVTKALFGVSKTLLRKFTKTFLSKTCFANPINVWVCHYLHNLYWHLQIVHDVYPRYFYICSHFLANLAPFDWPWYPDIGLVTSLYLFLQFSKFDKTIALGFFNFGYKKHDIETFAYLKKSYLEELIFLNVLTA